MKKLLMLFVGLMTTITFGQTILSENFGTPAASTAMATYTGYQSTSPITFAGTGTIRSTSASSGYTGASGAGNAYLGSTGTANQYLQINGLNTSAYTPANIKFTFGYWTYAIPTTQMVLQYSTDGSTWTNIAFLNNTAAGWNQVTIPNGTLPASSTLSLKFSQPGTTDQFRIDDIYIANINPNCLFTLGTPTTVCNTTTYNLDTYSATIPFTGGTGGTFTITSTSGTIAGDNPSTIAAGNIIVNGITEGTSITIHTVGASCDWTLPIPSRDCKPVNTLPFHEPFPYTGGYALGSSQMWNYISTGDDITGTSPGLTYTGLNTSGNAVSFSGSGNDALVPFTDQTSGVVYVSFLMQVTSTSNITTYPALTYFAGFTKSTPSFLARLYLNTTSATQYQIGLDSNAPATPPAPPLDTTLRNVGDVVLVIMSYDFSNNTLKAWINPSNLTSFSTTTPTLTSTATTAFTDLGGFFLRQDAPATTPTMTIDEIKIFNNPTFLLGTNQVSEISGLKIYPNPTKNILNITTEMNSTKTVQVYDMIGQQVINTQIENQLNVSNLTPGMYIARITEEGKTATTKLVIQ